MTAILSMTCVDAAYGATSVLRGVTLDVEDPVLNVILACTDVAAGCDASSSVTVS